MSTEDFHLHLDSVGIETDWIELPDSSEEVSIHNLAFRGPLHRLFQYLLETGSIDELELEG
jgi:hypothetical protein